MVKIIPYVGQKLDAIKTGYVDVVRGIGGSDEVVGKASVRIRVEQVAFSNAAGRAPSYRPARGGGVAE